MVYGTIVNVQYFKYQLRPIVLNFISFFIPPSEMGLCGHTSGVTSGTPVEISSKILWCSTGISVDFSGKTVAMPMMNG